MFKNNLKKNLFALVLAIFLVFTAWGVKKTESQSLTAFGGKILSVQYCCNGIMLTIGPPSAGTYMYYWATKLYANYNVFEPGPYVLGRGGKGGFCSNLYNYPPCFRITSTTGFFTMMGTSGI